jgi:phosphopantetheine adenylyltransferase
LYLPDSSKHLRDADIAVSIVNYTNLARSDAARFGFDHGIVAAIHLSSVRTGVDFSYLMNLAATESNFEPESEAATLSASDMYQYTHDTWLNILKKHGAKYGLVGDYAAKIEHYKTLSGYQRPFVRD